jgi:hypothetical protein
MQRHFRWLTVEEVAERFRNLRIAISAVMAVLPDQAGKD